MAAMQESATAGGWLEEKRKGRARWMRWSRTVWLAAT